MNKDLIALAVRVYNETKSGNAVARRLDVAHTTAYRLLHAGGVKLPDRHGAEVSARKKKLHGDAAKAVAADYAAGTSMAEIKAKHGVGEWAIRTAVRDAGVGERNRGGAFRQFTAEHLEEATRLYREGMSQAQIAAHFNMGLPTVTRALKAGGVEPRRRYASGSSHGGWKGGRLAGAGGYVLVHVARDDLFFSMASGTGYCMEHRLVMARALGRPLTKTETVHHINGDKTDNRLTNLQLRFGRHGKGTVMICAKCGSHDIRHAKLAD